MSSTVALTVIAVGLLVLVGIVWLKHAELAADGRLLIAAAFRQPAGSLKRTPAYVPDLARLATDVDIAEIARDADRLAKNPRLDVWAQYDAECGGQR